MLKFVAHMAHGKFSALHPEGRRFVNASE